MRKHFSRNNIKQNGRTNFYSSASLLAACSSVKTNNKALLGLECLWSKQMSGETELLTDKGFTSELLRLFEGRLVTV